MDFYAQAPSIKWTCSSEALPNSPPGLEHLAGVNQLIVCQRFDLEEERTNRYLQYFCGISRPFTMKIYDNVGQDVITIRKALRCSCCCKSCCLQKLLSLEEEIVIGRISKPCTGSVRGLLTNADKFRIQFPINLDVKSKALILGASFLIDYMYFEICP
ncbi:phospholipid scramblase 1-like [Octodon degus]|uniref:Phospholipid scramblase n=1 Tax=Octodon degus TaxID=10160 RepID=A0A6P6E9I0_OCTDE|nr:phospholipid scramblase 1-like [Octodon degus]